MHKCLFFSLTSLIQLPVSLVNVVLDLCELLNCPLAHIDKCLHLLSCICIQSCKSGGKLVFELCIVRAHEIEYVDHYPKSLIHLLGNAIDSIQKAECDNLLLLDELKLLGFGFEVS